MGMVRRRFYDKGPSCQGMRPGTASIWRFNSRARAQPGLANTHLGFGRKLLLVFDALVLERHHPEEPSHGDRDPRAVRHPPVVAPGRFEALGGEQAGRGEEKRQRRAAAPAVMDPTRPRYQATTSSCR